MARPNVIIKLFPDDRSLLEALFTILSVFLHVAKNFDSIEEWNEMNCSIVDMSVLWFCPANDNFPLFSEQMSILAQKWVIHFVAAYIRLVFSPGRLTEYWRSISFQIAVYNCKLSILHSTIHSSNFELNLSTVKSNCSYPRSLTNNSDLQPKIDKLCTTYVQKIVIRFQLG